MKLKTIYTLIISLAVAGFSSCIDEDLNIA